MTFRTLTALLGTVFMTASGAQAAQPPAAPAAATASVPEPPGLPAVRAQAPQPTTAASSSAAQPGAASAGVPGGPQPREASSLGRFFFTPSERARLDELRHSPPAQRAETVKAQPPPPPPAPRYVTVNGVVRRSDGESTIWLNNQPVQGQQPADGLVASPARGQSPSHVTVRVPQSGRSIDVKVGQQVEVNSGAVREAYRAPAAAQPAGTPRSETSDTRTGVRRSDREREYRDREFVRDLVREIEAESAAAAGANRQGTPAPSNDARR